MHRGVTLSFLTSPAVVVSALLTFFGLYLWQEHPAEAIVAFLWIPMFLTGWLIHFVFHPKHGEGLTEKPNLRCP